MTITLLWRCVKDLIPLASKIARRLPRTSVRKLGFDLLEERLVPTNWNVTVTTPDNATTPGTLRWAYANTAATGDTITFDPAIDGQTIALTSPLEISKSLSINGPGASNIFLDGDNSHGVINIDSGNAVSITGITVTNGVSYSGGGINNAGILTLTNVSITGNGAIDNLINRHGGGIFNSGTLTIRGCTIADNVSYSDGGGIENNGTLSISDSTIFGNAAYSYGGGIYNFAGDLTLTNVTISGGKRWNNGDYYLQGGGLCCRQGTVTLDNTIIADNTVSTTLDVGGTIAVADYSLIGTAEGYTISSGTNNLLGANSGLATTLADNGGLTQSVALLPGGAATGAGDPAQAGSVSQNGVTRPTPCDIGAYQSPAGGSAPALSSVVVNSGDAAYTNSFGLAVSLAGQNSLVEQILVTFNESVTLDPGAFTITSNSAGVNVVGGPGPNSLPVNANFVSVPASVNRQWIVTFSGPGTTAIPFGSGNFIKDGLYVLNTVGSKVHANGQTATDISTGFWALFGSAFLPSNLLSSNFGDGGSEVVVDSPDFFLFKATFGSETDVPGGPGQPFYDVRFDSNLDGIIDAADFLKFKQNFGADWVF